MSVVNEFGNKSSLLTDINGNLRVATVSDTIETFYTRTSAPGGITLEGGTAENDRKWEVFPSGASGSLTTSVINSVDFRNAGSFIVSVTCSKDGNGVPRMSAVLLGFNDDVLAAGIASTEYYQRATILWSTSDAMKQFSRAGGTVGAPVGFDQTGSGHNQWAETSPNIPIQHKYYKLHLVNETITGFDVQATFSASS
tara:strand:+ start:714 stop:1304 length:591 start_codon:yes stop_codon:yes gene_type:complete